MEWVQGDSIVTYVARNSKDPRVLAQLASKWIAMLDGLQKSASLTVISSTAISLLQAAISS